MGTSGPRRRCAPCRASRTARNALVVPRPAAGPCKCIRSQSTTEARSLVRTGTKTPQRGLTAALHVGDSPSVDRLGGPVDVARVHVHRFPSEADEFAWCGA